MNASIPAGRDPRPSRTTTRSSSSPRARQRCASRGRTLAHRRPRAQDANRRSTTRSTTPRRSAARASPPHALRRRASVDRGGAWSEAWRAPDRSPLNRLNRRSAIRARPPRSTVTSTTSSGVKRRSEHTLRNYRHDIDAFFDFLARRGIQFDAAGRTHGRAFLAELRERRRRRRFGEASRHRYPRLLRLARPRGPAATLEPGDSILRLRYPKAPRRLPHFLSQPTRRRRWSTQPEARLTAGAARPRDCSSCSTPPVCASASSRALTSATST